jgi:hypothetical protein
MGHMCMIRLSAVCASGCLAQQPGVGGQAVDNTTPQGVELWGTHQALHSRFDQVYTETDDSSRCAWGVSHSSKSQNRQQSYQQLLQCARPSSS